MPLFDRDAEVLRKQNLKILEDKRIQFAEKLDRMGFKPERMLFCSNEQGSFTALARWEGKYCVVVSPVFGQEGDFVLDTMDRINYEMEDVFEKGTGLNGAFGFGKKGAKGFNLNIRLSDDSLVVLQVVAGRTSWAEAKLKKNPLLSTKRRRGDANIIWDLVPIEPSNVSKIEEALNNYYLAD